MQLEIRNAIAANPLGVYTVGTHYTSPTTSSKVNREAWIALFSKGLLGRQTLQS